MKRTTDGKLQFYPGVANTGYPARVDAPKVLKEAYVVYKDDD